MKELLILSRYGRLGASSRVRLFQYVPELEAHGFRVTLSPLLDDDYLRTLYSQDRRRPMDMVRAYAARLHQLMQARRYDLLWIEKEVLPFVPGLLESRLMPRRVPYVLDYDDATFHKYDRHASPVVQRLLGGKLHPLIAASTAVTAGNTYLAGYAERAGAGTVHIVPTVVDLARYQPAEVPARKEMRIGWIGSPSTTPYLGMLKAPLEALAAEQPIRLVTIGAGTLPDIGIPTECHQWTEADESTLLAGCHLGIMPLPDEPWERGKCGYKLIQCMACGLPVVASPVGANPQIVTPDVGFLATSDEQWLDALRTLARDRTLGRQLGRAGRRSVERLYSLQTLAPIITDIMQRAANRPE